MSDLSSKVPRPELLMSFPGEPPELAAQAAQAKRSLDPPRQTPVVHDRWPKPKTEPTSAREPGAESAVMLARADGLRLSLDELRTIGAQLVRAYGRLDEQYQEIAGRSTQALDALATIERRVTLLDGFRDLDSLIGERMAVLRQLDAEIERRVVALRSQDSVVETLEARANLAATSCERQIAGYEARYAELNAADGALARATAAVEQVEARAHALSNDLDGRDSALYQYEGRLGCANATTTALASTVASLERQTAALVAEQPSMAAAEQALRRAQQLAAETASDLQRVQAMQDELQQTLLRTRTEARSVARLVQRRTMELAVRRQVLAPAVAWLVRARARVVAWLRADWASTRSSDVPLSLAAGASVAVVAVLVVSWVSSRGGQPNSPVPETKVASAVLEPPGGPSARTTDIALPSAPPRPPSRRSGLRPSRPARAR